VNDQSIDESIRLPRGGKTKKISFHKHSHLAEPHEHGRELFGFSSIGALCPNHQRCPPVGRNGCQADGKQEEQHGFALE
jgi:hypothetical protein